MSKFNKFTLPFPRFLILSCSILLLASQSALAAQDNNTADKNSVQTDFQQLRQLDHTFEQSSLMRAELERQSQNLKPSEQAKRSVIQLQLTQLDNQQQTIIAKKESLASHLREVSQSYPVAPFSEDLFFIYARLGSFSAQERASAISERIKKFGATALLHAEPLTLSATEQTMDIVHGDLILASITDEDALWMNSTKKTLAENYAKKISSAIEKYKASTGWKTLMLNAALALLVLGTLGGIIFFVSKLFKKTAVLILLHKDKYIQGIKIYNYELLDVNRLVQLFLSLNTLIKWLLIAVLIYITLPVLFSLFPWTRHFSETLLGYFMDPAKKILLGVWNYLPNLFTIIVIWIVFRYVFRFMLYIKDEIAAGKLTIPGFYADWAAPTYQIFRALVFAFMVVIIFPYLPGSDSPIFQGVSVFLGVLLTFGSSGSLSNLMAGLVLTYMRAFKIGDRVKIGEVVGDVVEKNMLVTRIKTIKNEEITIPNSAVMNSHTINFSTAAQQGVGLIVHTTITIGYDAPWRQVHALMIAAANATDLIEAEPKPFVLQTSLDDFYVSYQINAYTKAPNKQAGIYSHLHQNIQDKFNESGVEILSPHYRAMRDGNGVTIPSDYLPGDYIAPAFRVQHSSCE